MIKIHEILINTIKDYEKLMMPQLLDKKLIDATVIEYLKTNLGLKVGIIAIEYPYYEKDYLSTYYRHYSKKLKVYTKKCCRLHILAKDNEYFGSITLRPTVEGTKIGKTYLCPEFIISEKAYLIQGNFDAHVVGEKINISCFPWMKQETDISVCAHVSAWTILRYFGNAYENCVDTTMGELVDKIKSDYGRKIPSNGLTPVQVSDVFEKYRFSPIIREGAAAEWDFSFWDEILSYIESGIPMVGFIRSKSHAVSIIGRSEVKNEILKNPELIDKFVDSASGILLHSRLIRELYVMDDNYFPYRKVGVELPREESDVDYNFKEFNFAVIPLFSRMQLTYSEVYTRFKELFLSDDMKWPKPAITKIYITASNVLKELIAESDDVCEDLKSICLNLNMSKFVWCIDISSKEEFADGLISGRIIIDTTCSSKDRDPWLIMHDSDEIRFRDEETHQLGKKSVHISPYKVLNSNLKKCEPIERIKEGTYAGKIL